MKKLLTFFIISIFLLSMPVTVLADAPAPMDDNANYVYIHDTTNISILEIWGHDKDNNYALITQSVYSDSMRTSSDWTERFFNKDAKFKDFQLVITLNDGQKIYSNTVNIVVRGSYNYYLLDNKLSEWKSQELSDAPPFDGLGIFFLLPIMLILPLLFTVLVEWIISLFFKLKPGKYVAIINLITNPILSIILISVYFYNKWDYTVSLIILELIIIGVEFLYYTTKYNEYTKKRLLLFSVMANIASWLLYWLFSILFGI